MTTRVRARFEGRVQGVGFRPAVYRWAVACGLAGFVRNDPSGVEIDVEGEEEMVDRFFSQFPAHAPPLAAIGRVVTRRLPPHGYDGFEVRESGTGGDAKVHVPADVATCDACLRELRDPMDRRHRYPFINCVDCGPRFSIIESLPYDRPGTTMKGFALCDACAMEYDDPKDRRFHAQPNACPRCGPRLLLLDGQGVCVAEAEQALARAHEMLDRGDSVAIKGVGGYHLACDALNLSAVGRLRRGKNRPHKALAVMFRDLPTLTRYLAATRAEIDELTSPARPIVIVAGRLNEAVSPDTNTTGAFLPHAPIHHLLLQRLDALVMTSGNRRDEPIATDEEAARRLVGPIADAVLANDRPIAGRCDDSVMKVVDGERRLLRRSRGYVPAPMRIAAASPEILATGSDLKNTFCVTRLGESFVSQHIGDLSDASTYAFYTAEIERWKSFLQISPTVVAYDLHPGYLASAYARMCPQVEKVAVQHHHAHIASILGERGIERPVIGVALDGTGYGCDGTIWGGEFLLADRTGFRRLAHFKPYPLPGGDRAIEQPWRTALSILHTEQVEWAHVAAGAGSARQPLHSWLTDGRAGAIAKVLESGINCPLASSAGRLFDAVAALLGIVEVNGYEAQGAIRLESLASSAESASYAYHLRRQPGLWVLDFGRAFQAIARDWRDGEPAEAIAARFLNTVAAGVGSTADSLCAAHGVGEVALSGGVFQNAHLLTLVSEQLRGAGLKVYANSLVPANDGGISFGQAVVAVARTGAGGPRPCA